MAERLQVEVTVRDESGRELNRFSQKVPAAGPGPMVELFKAHHSEAMNNYRFYGTLRALIAWTPAVIAMAVLSYVGDNLNSSKLWISLAPTAFLLVVFALIYGANISLQQDQRRSLGVASVARRYWIEAIRNGDTGPLTYSELEAIAGRELGKFKSDMSSKLLLGFLLTLLIAQGLFVLWEACWKQGASGCTMLL